MRVRISYPLNRNTPLYPGTPPVTIGRLRSIGQGDSANTSCITLPGHAGTHIDLPRHFCETGGTAEELLEPENTIGPVYVINLPKEPGSSIGPGDLRKTEVPADARGLLLRTGFFRYRSTDPDRYTREHPWVDPGVAGLLREQCPELIVFGLDTISISNPQQRTTGHEAHRAFLCGKRPIMLLEDLDLSHEHPSRHPWNLTFCPLVLDELDGVPVLAFLE
jgi:arylformamidase